MIKAMMFDVDGMLVDSLPLYLQHYDNVLKELGYCYSGREIVNLCFGRTEASICQDLGIPEKSKQFQDSYFSKIRAHYDKVILFPGARETLELAKTKGIKLAIISFAFRWYVEEVVKRLDLQKYFDMLIGFDDVKKAKPDPEAALLVCRKFGVEPSEAVMLGDSKSDIIMGKSAGCQTVLFYPPGYEMFYDFEWQKQSHPDIIATNFNEIKSLL